MNNSNTSGWFAPSGIANLQNAYFRARTRFLLPAIPSHCEIKISAESCYRF